MAQLAKKSVEGDWDWKEEDDVESWSKRTDALWKKLTKANDAVKDGEIVGLLIAFPIADGQAWYRVSKAKPLTLQHIPVGDAWQIPHAHIRGIRKQDIHKIVFGRNGATSW